MADLPETVRYDGSSELQDAWKQFVTSLDKLYPTTSKAAANALNAIVFNRPSSESDGEPKTVDADLAIQAGEALARLTLDKKFQPLHKEVVKHIVDQWLSIRERAGLSAHEARNSDEYRQKRADFLRQPETHALVSVLYSLTRAPVMAIAMSHPRRSRFTESQAQEMCDDAFFSTVMSYDPAYGSSFVTLINSGLRRSMFGTAWDTSPKQHISLSGFSSNFDPTDPLRLETILKDEKAISPVRKVMNDEEIGAMLSAVENENVLDERQKFIIKRKYGIGGYEKGSLREIGEELSLSRQMVLNISRIAMKKLQHHFGVSSPSRSESWDR